MHACVENPVANVSKHRSGKCSLRIKHSHLSLSSLLAAGSFYRATTSEPQLPQSKIPRTESTESMALVPFSYSRCVNAIVKDAAMHAMKCPRAFSRTASQPLRRSAQAGRADLRHRGKCAQDQTGACARLACSACAFTFAVIALMFCALRIRSSGICQTERCEGTMSAVTPTDKTLISGCWVECT